jgi:hypothetical protein
VCILLLALSQQSIHYTHTHTHAHTHSHSLAAQEKLEEDAVILIKDIEGERKEYETKIKSLDRKERDLASQVCL